jgi:hypothetical protein
MHSHVRRIAALVFLTLPLCIAANGQGLPDAPGATARLVSDAAMGEPRIDASKIEDAKIGEPDSKIIPEKNLMAVAMKAKRPAAAHPFFDRTSLMSMGVETGALLADGIATQARLGQVLTRYKLVNGVQTPYQVRIVEVDPIGKLFVNHGWPGMIGGGALTLGADMGVRYWLHKTNHHRLERIVPFAIAASNAFAAWHDTRY